jgi:signal transduction histidine kinase
MNGPVLELIGSNLQMDDLELTYAPAPPGDARASVPLLDAEGTTIAHIAWTPPRPGASILGKVAVPLGIAVTLIAVIAAVLARYSARSAVRLEEALDAARAADRIKTDFLSNVSHELRTPMNGIIGVAQILAHDALTGGQRELVGVLQASADAQLALINDLLDITRMESGNRELDRLPFAPAATLLQVLDLMRPAAARKGLRLETDIAGLSGLTVLGDERALRQIVTNLLGNAVKFTAQGRVDLDCHVTRREDVAELVLRVRDTGPGIAAEDQGRIFDRFVQLDASRTRSTEGTGLGLAISQGLAGMIGGHIEVESAPGEGATFTLRLQLPLPRAHGAPAPSLPLVA